MFTADFRIDPRFKLLQSFSNFGRLFAEFKTAQIAGYLAKPIVKAAVKSERGPDNATYSLQDTVRSHHPTSQSAQKRQAIAHAGNQGDSILLVDSSQRKSNTWKSGALSIVAGMGRTPAGSELRLSWNDQNLSACHNYQATPLRPSLGRSANLYFAGGSSTYTSEGSRPSTVSKREQIKDYIMDCFSDKTNQSRLSFVNFRS
ncbi:MAG: hypothetical protein Q9218_008122 [Villophora microphyllina]